MTKERQMIAWAVLQGELPAEQLSYDEIGEIGELIFDAVAAKLSLPLLSNKIH